MQITAKTKLVGIFGYPISHSLSPVIHNAAFKESGLDFVYVAFPVKPSFLSEAVKAIRALEIVGVNVTVPHKKEIIKFLDELSPEVEKIGAVNTVVNLGGKLKGYNTDFRGFLDSLKVRGVSLEGKRVLLVGAGGAALAVAFALLGEKIDTLFLINRTSDRLKEMVERLLEFFPEKRIKIVDYEKRNSLSFKGEVDILINATSLGMKEKDPPPISLDGFSSTLYVYDVVYNRETELLKEAKRRKMKYQDGLDMLIFQAAAAFEIWTGKKAPISTMKEVAESFLRK
ncbi:shikimate dehydrogenase [Candidatus Aerophobetes bacterium]|nr:shikimate dehydrogenase [Candidatus Aerophobetes bacterium]